MGYYTYTVDKDPAFVVLLTANKTGMVVYVDSTSLRKLGEYRTDWSCPEDAESWRPYDKQVTLSND